MGLMAAGLALSAIRIAVGAAGAIGQDEAEAANASYQAEVARNTKTIAHQNAQYVSQAGQAHADVGEVAADLASSGLDIEGVTLHRRHAAELRRGARNGSASRRTGAGCSS